MNRRQILGIYLQISGATVLTTHSLSHHNSGEETVSSILVTLVVVTDAAHYAVGAVRVSCDAHFPAEVDENVREVATRSLGYDPFRYLLDVVRARFVA